MNILVYLAVFLFFIVLFIVGVYNSGDVKVNLVLWEVGQAPMGLVIATAAIFGVAFACAVGIIDGIKMRIANRVLRKQVRRLEEDVDTLRLRLARHEASPEPAAARESASWNEPPVP